MVAAIFPYLYFFSIKTSKKEHVDILRRGKQPETMYAG